MSCPFEQPSTQNGAIGPVLFFTFKKSVASARHRPYADPRLPLHLGKKLRICTGANSDQGATSAAREALYWMAIPLRIMPCAICKLVGYFQPTRGYAHHKIGITKSNGSISV
jgi:hypothetical protein